MSADFYSSPIYRQKQSVLMKQNWAKGLFNSVRKNENRICNRTECKKVFVTKPSDPKIYCSSSCSASASNSRRRWSLAIKSKIANSLRGRPSPYRGIVKVPREDIVCSKLGCRKSFLALKTRRRKFCSVACSISFTGKKPTSPKAARGKAGIRKDIDNKTYFFSRWEANIARLYSHLGIKWIHQPRTFDIGKQNYTPDFYLPEQDTYIEVKNFLNDYSRTRDNDFRKIYPDLKLKMILKDEYLELQEKYSRIIKNWEFSNSKFNI